MYEYEPPSLPKLDQLRERTKDDHLEGVDVNPSSTPYCTIIISTG